MAGRLGYFDHNAEHARLRAEMDRVLTALFPLPPPKPPPVVEVGERLAFLSGTGAHVVSPIPGMRPDWSWATHGRPGMWPPFNGREGHNAWGQITRTTPGSFNVGLQTSTPVVAHRIDGAWRQVADAGAMTGAWYTVADFASTPRRTDISYDPVTRISTVDLTPLFDGVPVWWHWWYHGDYPRYPLPHDGTPVASAVWMRLVGPDADRARLVAAFAGDTHQTIESGAPSGDLGIPVHDWVTAEWQLFGYVTAPPAVIAADPPPIPPHPTLGGT
jgi:hypothetical protein